MNYPERIIWDSISLNEINYQEISREIFYWFITKLEGTNNKIVDIREDQDNSIITFNNYKYRIFAALFPNEPKENILKVFRWKNYLLAKIIVIEKKYWKKVIQILDLI